MKIEEIMAAEYHRVAIDGLTDSGKDAMRYVIAALEQSGYAIVKTEDLFQLWVNAFDSSGEGWNGEFPMDVKQARWKIEKANAQIAAMIQQAKEDV